MKLIKEILEVINNLGKAWKVVILILFLISACTPENNPGTGECIGGISTTQISNNMTWDSSVQINGDYVVWYGKVNGDDAILLYQISSGITTQVSDKTPGVCCPQVSGGLRSMVGIWCGLGF